MSKWIPVYRDKQKRIEDWACTGCGSIDRDHGHHEGPQNGLCRCDSRPVMVPSDAYREGYDKIRWDDASR